MRQKEVPIVIISLNYSCPRDLGSIVNPMYIDESFQAVQAIKINARTTCPRASKQEKKGWRSFDFYSYFGADALREIEHPRKVGPGEAESRLFCRMIEFMR